MVASPPVVQHVYHDAPSSSTVPVIIHDVHSHHPASCCVVGDEEHRRTRRVVSGLANQVAEENLLGEVKHLQKQLQLYREKWLRAQDEVEELQRRLASKKMEEEAVPPPSHGAPPSPPTSNESYIRELEMQKEEIHRLERRLERQADSASFREEQLRQEQMDLQRHHRAALNQLQDQLQQAHREVSKAEEDRQKAIRQLRDYVEDGKLKEVLQQQKEALHQRMTELTHELAEVRGNEKELKLAVQREMAEKIQLTHTRNEAESQLRLKERQERLLNEEVQILQKKVGEAEGRVFALQQQLSLLSAAPDKSNNNSSSGSNKGETVHIHHNVPCAAVVPAVAGCCHMHHNPDALASELKGYASLMALNSKQQERLSELEVKLLSTTNALYQAQHEAKLEQWIAGSPLPPGAAGVAVEPSPRLQQLRGSLLVEIAQLRDELEKNRGRQKALLEQWEQLHKEHREVRSDNALLASGTEKLMSKLTRLREKKKKLHDKLVVASQRKPNTILSVQCRREEGGGAHSPPGRDTHWRGAGGGPSTLHFHRSK